MTEETNAQADIEANVEMVVADLFERAGVESFEAGASFALARVFATWAQRGEAPLDAKDALQVAKDGLSDLWEDLSDPTKKTIANLVDEALARGADPTAFFEEVLRRHGQTVSRAASLTATGHKLNNFLGQIAPNARTVLDPACGFGGSLVAVSEPRTKVTGFDRNPTAAAVAKLRLMLKGVEDARVGVSDALVQRDLGRFDLVVAHPPQSTVLERWEVTPDVANRLAEGRLGSVDGDTAWLQFVADHTTKDGLGLIVLPLTFMETRRQPEKVLEALAQEGRLEAIIRLPSSYSDKGPQILLAVSGSRNERKTRRAEGKTLVLEVPEGNERSAAEALNEWLDEGKPPRGLDFELVSAPEVVGARLIDLLDPKREETKTRTRIDGLQVSNFKAFGPSDAFIPLRPLTLIFGQNSAGKSTIIQGLMTLARSVELGHFDASPWGAWSSLVHGHDRNATMKLGVRTADGSSFTYAFDHRSGGGAAPDLDLTWDGSTFHLRGTGDEFNVAGGRFERLGLLVGPAVETNSEPLADLGELFVDASEELLSLTHHFHHLGPLRTPPHRYTHREDSREDTPFYLAKNPSERHQVSRALQKLGVDYEVDVVNPVDERYRPLVGNVVSLILRDRTTGLELSAQDVGFGVSQVLPIATELSVRTHSLIAVEEPEVYLHPSMQAALADLFIESVNPDGRGNQIVAETHSETLMLRVQRRIREQVLSHEDVLVLYVDKNEDGSSRVAELRLNEHGDFIDHWPHGFFDDQFNELFGAL